MIAPLVRNRWALVPIALLASAIAFCVLTVVLAVADHPLGVEPQYDSKAAGWQATADQLAENDKLRWLVTPSLTRLDPSLAAIRLRIEDRHAIPIERASVTVECIPIVNADRRSTLALAEVAPGEYAGAFDVALEGAHEFRVVVDAGAKTYTDQFRRVVPMVASGPAPAEGDR